MSVACNIMRMCVAPGVQVVALVPVAGPVPPPSMARGNGFVNLLGADEVDVYIEGACGDDVSFTGDDFGGDTDDHVFVNARHDVGIACFANANDTAIFDADVGFVDACVVNDERVGDDEIQRVFL